MHVVILYGSTEGQTAKIAGFVADRLRAAGNTVESLDASLLSEDQKLPRADLYLIGASVHAGGFQASVEHAVAANSALLNGARSVFFSVSLSAAGDDPNDLAGLDRCEEEFLRKTGWKPERIERVAGAFRFTRYDFFKRLAMQWIAHQKKQPTDASRDYELTDWAALGRFADGLAAKG